MKAKVKTKSKRAGARPLRTDLDRAIDGIVGLTDEASDLVSESIVGMQRRIAEFEDGDRDAIDIKTVRSIARLLRRVSLNLEWTQVCVRRLSGDVEKEFAARDSAQAVSS